jgi:protein-S-isoprenylcysteine O-methyltransferase Ste14
MAASRSTPRLRFTAVLLIGLLALVAVSRRPASAAIAGGALVFLGFACVACAALGRVWTSVFIAGFKDERLVTHGPYAALRHPLYALSMLALLGLGLTTRSVVITLALLVVFGLVYAASARAEDAFLREAHPAQFERYAGAVRALLPRWSAYDVPATLEVRPRVLWKAFLDAGSMLGLWALLVAADALQRSGITPTWITLP